MGRIKKTHDVPLLHNYYFFYTHFPFIFFNRCKSSKDIQRNDDTLVSHIFRERNHVTDKLANLGLGIMDSL
jgi:hypothetical protein